MIKRFLEWCLSKFEDKQVKDWPKTEWPFPTMSENFEPRPKTKPRVAKATTRPAKKAPAAIKTAAKKTAKKAK